MIRLAASLLPFLAFPAVAATLTSASLGTLADGRAVSRTTMTTPGGVSVTFMSYGVCAAWSAPGPEPEVPHDTAVPTLVLAGQFDPNITPEQSRLVADRMGPQARWILFAGIGHSVRHFSTCAQTLVAAFVAQPEVWHDPGCSGSGKAFGPAQP